MTLSGVCFCCIIDVFAVVFQVLQSVMMEAAEVGVAICIKLGTRPGTGIYWHKDNALLT